MRHGSAPEDLQRTPNGLQVTDDDDAFIGRGLQRFVAHGNRQRLLTASVAIGVDIDFHAGLDFDLARLTRRKRPDWSDLTARVNDLTGEADLAGLTGRRSEGCQWKQEKHRRQSGFQLHFKTLPR
ncbi:hypothetical protein EMIT0347P_90215 [Pseudomonas sp. IT-347P]